MEFFNKTGKMALGSRMRHLTSVITEDAAKIYELYDVEFAPKWFPVFFALSRDGEQTITEIAGEIGHSQPSVTKLVKEMVKAGLVKDNIKSEDKRRNVVALTSRGKKLVEKIIDIQCADIETAIDGIIAEAKHNLWEALAEWEFLLEQKSMYKRVFEQKRSRESKAVQIIPYEDQHQSIFKSLNEEWISSNFKMETSDYKALDKPRENILEKGGEIFVAVFQDQPVGVCALMKMDDPEYDYEIAKMAVSPHMRGKNIGRLLMDAAIDKARALGASKIYLESNTVLKPAVSMYYKLGFQKIIGRPSPYERCNIQMEYTL